MLLELPEYAERLDALHESLIDDFRRILAILPLAGSETIIDAGCGDGFFTALLAERLPTGKAVGLDNSTAFLHVARGRLAGEIAARRAELLAADVCRLPMDSDSVDGIWSVHSTQSYSNIPHVLQEFRRVLRPGGLLAILESDNIHSIMLSWPPDLELALRQAEHREIGDEDSYIGTYFPRFAQRLLREAGYDEISRQYMLISRQRPCSPTLERYVELYLRGLQKHHNDRLSARAQSRLQELAAPNSPHFLPRQENFFFGSIQVLLTARKIGPPQGSSTRDG